MYKPSNCGYWSQSINRGFHKPGKLEFQVLTLPGLAKSCMFEWPEQSLNFNKCQSLPPMHIISWLVVCHQLTLLNTQSPSRDNFKIIGTHWVTFCLYMSLNSRRNYRIFSYKRTTRFCLCMADCSCRMRQNPISYMLSLVCAALRHVLKSCMFSSKMDHAV